MKTFQRKKIINGIEYIYEITPYYDSKTKKIRQKSKYLGKDVEGEVVKVRKSIPRKTFDYGEIIPYKNIFQKLSIDVILKDICNNKTDAFILEILILNRLIRPLALQNINSWYEGTILSKEQKVYLSSQQLSDFLIKIGTSDIPQLFIERFLEKNNSAKTLVYDLTSLSSYSNLNTLLEYGHNKDNNGLPQFNLSLTVSKDCSMPLLYDIYPGSIKDVSTIRNSIKKIRNSKLDVTTLILDRGFFSESNINDLLKLKIPFIIGIPFTLKEAKELIKKNLDNIGKAEYIKKYDGKLIFTKKIEINIGRHKFNGFLFSDIKLKQTMQNNFLERIHDIKEKLEKIKPTKKRKPKKTFELITKNLKKYFQYKIVNKYFKITLNEEKISQHLNKVGIMILLYNGKFNWQNCLKMYKEKDIVEKCFRGLKNDILTSPFNVQSKEAIKALIFIMYVALIGKFKLQDIMIKSGLNKKYSTKKLQLELEKIKKVELTNGELLTTELTKKHKDILKILNP